MKKSNPIESVPASEGQSLNEDLVVFAIEELRAGKNSEEVEDVIHAAGGENGQEVGARASLKIVAEAQRRLDNTRTFYRRFTQAPRFTGDLR